MNENGTFGTGGWGIVIFLIILFWAFTGGGFGFGGFGRAAAYEAVHDGGCRCNAVTNCQAQLQEVKDTMQTQYLIEQTGHATQDSVGAAANLIGTKIDYYGYQNLRDQLEQARQKNLMLEARVYSDAQFNAVNARLNDIANNMLVKPNVTGIGAVCPNAGILNGLGVQSFNSCCNS
jgi:hypothetical protein